MAKYIIEVENLHKSFKGVKAVNGLTFNVEPGEAIGLLGPNGAGKTTAMQIMLGLIIPDSGTVKIFGLDIEKDRTKILQRCNFCSAYVFLPHNLKVWENLAVFAELYGVTNFKKKADDLLEMFEVTHLKNKITGQLSSGESTRVNLCKALISNPEILFLDEPTASLDPDIADKVRKILKQIQKDRQITLVNTSHNMKDIEEVCSHILFMQNGAIVASGSASEIKDNFNKHSLDEVFIHLARGQVGGGEFTEEHL